VIKPRLISLKWRLVRRLVFLQAAMVTLFVLLAVSVLWVTGAFVSLESEDDVISAVQEAVVSDPQGALALRATSAMKALRSDVPDIWFIVRDKKGRRLTEGVVPPEYARIGDALDDIGQARLGWNLGEPSRPTARVKWVDSAEGKIQIVTGPGGTVSLRRITVATSMLFLTWVLPGLVVTTLATLFATPVVVRRALAGLGKVAAEAERIDIGKRGTRLTVETVPAEVGPLVKAVNDALGRLDEGYERHKRFLGDAAHELRTPIAILQTRLESLPQGADKTRLLEDVARLSILAEQLLDIQRLDQQSCEFVRVDLVVLGRRVAADLAPLAIAAGYELSFEPEVEHLTVMGDPVSLERAMTNLVQNAIQHGGRQGMITIRVESPSTFAVMDEGPGIPIEHRERIFEPFHRLQQLDRGAGLGLNLVQEIVRRHNGHVAVVDRPGGGAYFRMSLSA